MHVKSLESTLDTLVIALCLDFWRRQAVILRGDATKRTDTEYRYYNFKIFDAAADIVGEDMAELYIKEIGERTGYAKSEAADVSEVTYKNYKRMIKDNIAKKLHLRD
ncbi:MAG: hypothetical protein J6V09_03555 [Clostridia bacterium]|nr:hypothetical protein [Clostridia bacterium]